MAQVRAWLNGQGWYDLRQYRFDPAFGGANIHWSRIVDLPIAGLILLGKLFTTGANAERMAVAVAPLLPYVVLLTGIALTARRLISPAAFVAALCRALFRRRDQRHVHADPDRPPRLAAGDAEPGDRRARRSRPPAAG